MVQLNIRVTTQIWKRQCDKACWNQCWALRVEARDSVPDLVKVMHMSSQSSAKSWDTHSDPCVPNPKQQSQKQLNFLVEISLLPNPRRLWIWLVPGIVLRAEEGRDLSISFGWIKQNERFMWLQLFRVWEGVVLHQMTIHAFSSLDGQPFSNNILIHSCFDDSSTWIAWAFAMSWTEVCSLNIWILWNVVEWQLGFVLCRTSVTPYDKILNSCFLLKMMFDLRQNYLYHMGIMGQIIGKENQIVCHKLLAGLAWVEQHAGVYSYLAISPMGGVDLIPVFTQVVFCKVTDSNSSLWQRGEFRQ